MYIRTYASIAVLEMNQYHIPTSITLAQGIFESGAGQSQLAKEANNHFGIKCHKDWTGKTFHRTDDSIDECFRKYDHAEESFRDHSYFLTQRDRYKGLFRLPITDYRAWAEGLQAAGYATNRQYAEKLIRTIEKYQLYLYDKPDYIAEATVPASDPDFERYPWIARFSPAGFADDGRRIYENNGLKCIVARNTDSMSKLSTLLDIPVKRLMKYNDLKYPGSFEAGQVVYLEPKRRKASVEFHIVQKGETLYEISQCYGIKMKLLLKRSGMEEGIEPYPGQLLPLR
ncbi:MAG: glucosaminidase domain-containing protein [Nitrospirae bacterium]|nr:glucosaminidase domain-containing protein [Nitrospirota bacterium]